MNILVIKTFISNIVSLLSHLSSCLILLRQVLKSDFIHMTVNCDDHKHFNLVPHQYHKCKKLFHFWVGVDEGHDMSII